MSPLASQPAAPGNGSIGLQRCMQLVIYGPSVIDPRQTCIGHYHHCAHGAKDSVRHGVFELLCSSQFCQRDSSVDMVSPCCDGVVGAHDCLSRVSSTQSMHRTHSRAGRLTSYKENMSVASTVSLLLDLCESWRSSCSFLIALPYVDTAWRRSCCRPGYCPHAANATAVVARCRTDDGWARLYRGTRYSRKPLVFSACCGSVTKFRKKKGTASHSGAREMVGGTACWQFQIKSSTSNVCSRMGKAGGEQLDRSSSC